jgi:hypothetical protein
VANPQHTRRHTLLLKIHTATPHVTSISISPLQRTSAIYRNSFACSPSLRQRQQFVVPSDVQVIFVLGLKSRQNSSAFIHLAVAPRYLHLKNIDRGAKRGAGNTDRNYPQLRLQGTLCQQRRRMGLPMILGCAIAHEGGHLLLGAHSHSSEGVMQAE